MKKEKNNNKNMSTNNKADKNINSNTKQVETLRLNKTKKKKSALMVGYMDNENKIKQKNDVGVLLKNKTNKFYDSKLQGKNIKIVKKDNTNKMIMSIITACFVMLLLVVSQFFMMESGGVFDGNNFNSGTKINGVNVGGLGSVEVGQRLSEVFTQKSESLKLKLKHGDNSWEFDRADFVVSSDIHVIIEEALKRENINNSYESQLDTVNKMTKNGNNYDVAFNYLYVGLDEKIDNIIKEINKDAVDSQIIFEPRGKKDFVITDEVAGLSVNKDQLYQNINDGFLNSNIVEVDIPTITVDAKITKEDNLKLTTKLSSYTTNVADSTGGRKHNVKLALDRVNGLIIKPGQTVSFNKLTAPHSSENGYGVATIIFNGQFVDGVGGGICQASTTLYNALILADVKIDNVYKHTLPVKYVPLGLDAMVSEGIADLKFTNESEYTLYIKTSYDSNSVTVDIFGKELEEKLEIKSRSEIIKKINHKGDIIKPDTKQEHTSKVLYKGEQYRLTYPRDGYEAKAYLDYYKNGNLVSSKMIRHEIYYPQQGVIIEGIEEKPAGFSDIEDEVQKIEPKLTNENSLQDVFILNQQNEFGLLDSIETMYCP